MKSICNFGYARSKRGSGSFSDMRGLLKYLQYRDDRDGHIPGAGGPDRWGDGRPQAGPLEYSLVVHRPERDYGEQMHAHVILAAATENALTGERTPLYNN